MKQLKQPSPTSPVEASFHLLWPPSHLPSLTSVCLSCQHCPLMHPSQQAPADPLLSPKAFPATTSSCFLAPPGGTPQSPWPPWTPTLVLLSCIILTARPASHRLPSWSFRQKRILPDPKSESIPISPSSAKQASQRQSKINK